MKKLLFILIILSIVPLLDLLKPGLPITHDGQDHVARIANFYQNLSEGNIIPRWAPNLNWGYGHPILMFLYPLPSYAASLFHFLGFSLIDSLKIIFGLAFSLSGVFMFIWLREFLGDYPGFIGALLYMFAPYRFVDLYVRGAIGEHFAFIFMPLILYFLLRVSQKKEHNNLLIVGGAISMSGLILSHNAISLMFLPLVFLYILYLKFFPKTQKNFIKNSLLFLFLGLGVSSFFLIPAFFEGKYTLRDIVTAKDYSTRFLDFGKFLYGQWSYGISGQFTVQIGTVQWILSVASFLSCLALYKRKNRLWILAFSSFVIYLLTIFLMTPYSKLIWDKITILQKFQFPWRFLSISVFLTSFLAAVATSSILRNKTYLVAIVTILVLLLNKDYWHAKGYLLKEESFFTGIYNGTTDTGESSPIWSVRFMETRPKSHIQVILDSAKIKELYRSSTKHEYEINAFNRTRIRENTLYFPGWRTLVDGTLTNIEFQDPQNRGVMTFFIPQGKHKVSLEFKETRLRLFADFISLFSLLVILILWKNKQFRLF